MKVLNTIDLQDVKNVYSGPEGEIWERLMGEQIHIGGFQSSIDLAKKANIQPGMIGIDLCCCTGAGMRFLVHHCNVAEMIGVDATTKMIELGRVRSQKTHFQDRISFHHADVCESSLDSEMADFIWGEDAWCYVKDKSKLIKEAVRLIKPQGIIAFTDWMEGDVPLSDDDAQRLLAFMKFPNILSQTDYRQLLEQEGCEIIRIENTKRFAPYVRFYIEMVEKQYTFDVLTLLDFDFAVLEAIAQEMQFLLELSEKQKIIQGLIVAKKL